ncbi:tyrosinase-like protein 1 [Mytilus edulis]|uniref:tyrosinase-like protein 1 n=1 Tax=Mytilus edulis TaxID=6550 RepID=UPI0039F14C46
MKPTHHTPSNFTAEERLYISSLFRQLTAETWTYTENKQHSNRFKRHGKYRARYRREVRSAPYRHWERYAAGVRRLKFDMSGGGGRSRYDTIADIHGLAMIQAHSGPNFLPWHRLYLLIYETALGVPIPYWDSSLDQEMADPTKSILWTSKYFGNGFGALETGPFAGFQTPGGALIRNIGSDGMLYDKRLIPRIWSKTRLREISDPTSAPDDGLEEQHNGVHIWVDGTMDSLVLAPHDPIFWLHHCFVDYIWEVFRMLQMSRGINPAFDFVPSNRTGHGVDEEAFGIEGYTNRDGYLNSIARLVQYDPTPKCPYCGFSTDLYCNGNTGYCVSREQPSGTYQGNRMLAGKIARENGLAEGKFGPVFKRFRWDKRVRHDSVTQPKKKKIIVWVKKMKYKRDIHHIVEP